MSVIENAIKHFSSKERREIHVPEWDVTLYSRNLTLENKGLWLHRSTLIATVVMAYPFLILLSLYRWLSPLSSCA